MEKTLKVARLNSEAKLPTRKHADDAGLDVYSIDSVLIGAHEVAVVGTGIVIEIPRGFVGLVKLKSRSNFLLGAGVIDSGYQGEIRIKLINPLAVPLQIKKGQAIAQLLIVPSETPAVEEVSLETITGAASDRGKSGGIHLPLQS